MVTPGNVLGLRVMHDRLARRKQAFGVAVALRGGQVENNILEDFFWRFETEGRRVTDIQFRIRWPSSSRRLAWRRTGPRMS